MVDHMLKGLWGGMIAGIAVQTLLLLIVLYKTNWNKEVILEILAITSIDKI